MGSLRVFGPIAEGNTYGNSSMAVRRQEDCVESGERENFGDVLEYRVDTLAANGTLASYQ